MFIKHLLNIPNVKQRFIQDRFGLLKEIIRNHLIRLPFQSITCMGSVKVTENGRPTPTLENMIGDQLRGVGGLCGHNNVNLQLQLESIGYNVQPVSGHFRWNPIPNNHFMFLVKVAPNRHSPEKRYLVDLGCGLPISEPIPLDDLPYHGRAGGLNFRYEMIDENNIQRVNEKGDPISGKHPDDFLSPMDYFVELTPKTFLDFHPIANKIFLNPKSFPALQSLICFRYLNITDDDFDIICISNLEMIRITKETRTSQVFTNYKDLRPKFAEFFPMLDPAEVDRMVEINSQYLDKKLRKLK